MSSGTPKAEVKICPGECRVPGLPNKASSRPEKKTTTQHGRCADPRLTTVDALTDGKAKGYNSKRLTISTVHKTK